MVEESWRESKELAKKKERRRVSRLQYDACASWPNAFKYFFQIGVSVACSEGGLRYY